MKIVRSTLKSIAAASSIMVFAITLPSVACASSVTYLTDFTKDNNIYTNLNEMFPHTGTGVPGTGIGTPDATYVFTPTATGVGNPDNLNYVNNGISFQLASDAVGHDFADIGSVVADTISIGTSNTQAIYFLMAAYDGVSTNITLTGSNGATQTFSNIYLPDFNGGTPINLVGSGVTDQTVFRVLDTGAGGTGNSTNGAYNNYDLTEVGLTLSSQFAGQQLTSATVSSNGYETLLLGATAVTSAPAGAVPETATWIMMIVGFGAIGGIMRRGYRKPENDLTASGRGIAYA